MSPAGGLVVFSTAATPEVASTLRLDTVATPGDPGRSASRRSDPRWAEASQYLRTLVVGGRNQSMSVRRYSYGPGVTVPPHRHGTDEIYFILAGDLEMDGRRLGPGDGFSVGAGTVYEYVTGDDGVEILKVRASEQFTTEFIDRSPA